MNEHAEALAELTRGFAEILDQQALKLDRIAVQHVDKADVNSAYYAMGAASAFRAIAEAHRDALPTEQHEWDMTLADIVDLPEVPE